MTLRNLSLVALAALLFGCCSISWATTYTLSVKATGLATGATLVVEDSSTDKLTFTKNATQVFTTTYTDGQSYSVTIVTQPTTGTCTLGTNASGTFGAKNITFTAN
jgi:hypothetical protein